MAGLVGGIESRMTTDKKRLIVEKMKDLDGILDYLRTNEFITQHQEEEFRMVSLIKLFAIF